MLDNEIGLFTVDITLSLIKTCTGTLSKPGGLDSRDRERPSCRD